MRKLLKLVPIVCLNLEMGMEMDIIIIMDTEMDKEVEEVDIILVDLIHLKIELVGILVKI